MRQGWTQSSEKKRTPGEVRADVDAVDVDGVHERLRGTLEVVNASIIVNGLLDGQVVLSSDGEAVFRDVDWQLVALRNDKSDKSPIQVELLNIPSRCS